mgnify:CR=1 FL=1
MSNETGKQYSWSTDEERFHDQCDSVEAAIAAAVEYHGRDMEVGSTVYVGEVLRVQTAQLISADSIIENMQVQAYDYAGEASEDYLASVTKEQEMELARLVAKWADSVEAPNFWQVLNTVPHVITAGDLEQPNG